MADAAARLEPYETSAHKASSARTCAKTKKPRYCEFQHMRPWCMERARDMTAMLQAPAAAESLFRTFTVGAHADALRENFYRCRRRAPMHEWPLVGLWLRNNSTLPPSALSLSKSTIEVVVASCQNDLWWLRFPLEPAQLAAFRLSLTRTTVYLKCGHRPSGARPEWELVELRNVGRNDHSFLRHIVDRYDSLAESVLFIKDTSNSMFQGQMSIPLLDLAKSLQLNSASGFVCGRPTHNAWPGSFLLHDAGDGAGSLRQFQLRAYATKHDQQRAGRTFGMARPGRKQRRADRAAANGAAVEFHSPWRPLGRWLDHGVALPAADRSGLAARQWWPVCYGGTFAAMRSSIRARPHATWAALEQSLRRGDNIEEGHFVERMWGALLTSDTAPVEPPRCPPPASLMRTAERPGLVFCCPSLHIAAESCRSGSHGGRVYRDGETPPPNPDA